VISFFNECIKKVDLNGKITQSIIFSAEEIYSDVRLRALSDEWSADYLTLYEAALLFRHYPANFKVAYAHGKSFDDSLLDYLAMNSQTSACAIYQMIFERFYKAEDYDLDSIILELMKILFKVGIIGVGVSSKRERWSYLGDKFPTSDKLSEMTFSIHPAFWRVLAVSN
jgi:hypothetical protein